MRNSLQLQKLISFRGFYLVPILALTLMISCGGKEKVVVSAIDGDITATLSNSKGYLQKGSNDFSFEIKKGNVPFAAKDLKVYIEMQAMGDMPHMKDDASLSPGSEPGKYSGKVSLQMGGKWDIVISYKNDAGEEQTLQSGIMAKE